MATSGPFTGAGVTALGLAAARAVETGRSDRLVEDPYARELFVAAGMALPMRLEWPRPGEPVTTTEALHLHGSRYIGLRTRVYDDELRDATAAGVEQVVLLGAGLDTRAYRLALAPAARVFELDRAPLLAWKRNALTATPRVRVIDVGVDLRTDWSRRLLDVGFDPAVPCVVVAEGLLAYLDEAGQRDLLERISNLAAPGSRLALDLLVGDPRGGDRLLRLSQRAGIDMDALIAPSGAADPGRVLAARGWEVDVEPVSAAAARYGRDLGDPFRGAAGEPPWLETVFLRARR